MTLLSWKATLLLLVIFFASAVTMVAITLNVSSISRHGISERIVLDVGIDQMGDPIGGGDGPH